MLKTLFSFVLIIFCFTLQAQQDTLKTFKKTSGFYVDASLGFDVGIISPQFNSFSEASVGYRFNDKFGLGISSTGFGVYQESAGGIGLQLRLTPWRRSLFKIESGFVWAAKISTDCCTSNPIYNRQKSSNYYFRASASFRFLKVFTYGLTYAIAPKLKCDEVETSTKKILGTYDFAPAPLVLTLGLAFPRYSKPEKIISE